MNQYVNKKFSNQYKATIGADFLAKDVMLEDKLVTMQVRGRHLDSGSFLILFPARATAAARARQPLSRSGTRLGRSGSRVWVWPSTAALMPASSSTTRPRPRWAVVPCAPRRAQRRPAPPGAPVQSFDQLDSWRDEFLVQAGPSDPDNFPFVLLGNKVDMPESAHRVSRAKAEAWCKSKGATVRPPHHLAGQRADSDPDALPAAPCSLSPTLRRPPRRTPTWSRPSCTLPRSRSRSRRRTPCASYRPCARARPRA